MMLAEREDIPGSLFGPRALDAHREYRRWRWRTRKPLDDRLPLLLVLGANVILAILILNMGLVIIQGVEAPFRELQRLGSWRSW